METLNSMAELTGGRAYVNHNDLEAAIADGMRTGANYYSMSYHPANQNWNGKFRKITVKPTRSDVKVLYRSGYYAVPDPLSLKVDPDRMIGLAMQPDAPVSTQLILKAHVVPPQDPGQPTAIDISIDAHDLVFTEDAAKLKTPVAQFVAVAYDSNGKQSDSFSLGFHPALSQAQMEALLHIWSAFASGIVTQAGYLSAQTRGDGPHLRPHRNAGCSTNY